MGLVRVIGLGLTRVRVANYVQIHNTKAPVTRNAITIPKKSFTY